MKQICLIFFLLCNSILFSQKKDSLQGKILEIEEVYADKDYYKKYKTALRRVRKVYPLALYAKEKIDEMDAELEQINSKRKKKKYTKKSNNELKEDFQYVIRDLYIEDGKVLMKLIHRETGMTVAEIIKKYRNSFRSELMDNLGKIWEQDLDSKYDPNGKDWIIEKVIQDIKNNTVAFEKEAKILTKEDFKASQKQFKINKKEAKKAMRAKRKSGS
jgi:hypothetical protein